MAAALVVVAMVGAQARPPVPTVSTHNVGLSRRLKMAAACNQFLTTEDRQVLDGKFPATTGDEVIRRIGEPDDVEPGNDGASKWLYGASGALRFPTLGWVVLDRDGRVYQHSGGLFPPVLGSIDEAQLRQSLVRIAEFPDPDGSDSGWNPGQAARTINVLRQSGRSQALAAVREYQRLTSVTVNRDEVRRGSNPIWILLRYLFGPNGSSRLWGTEPILVLGVPLLLRETGGGTGSVAVLDEDLAAWARRGKWQSLPLRPSENVAGVMAEAIRHPRFQALSDFQKSEVRRRLLEQILSMVRPAYQPQFLPKESSEARWDKVESELGKIKLRWIGSAGTYVRRPSKSQTAQSNIPDTPDPG